MAPDVVVTVAHVFQDAAGLPTSKRTECFFRTQGDVAGVQYYFSGRPTDVVVGSARPLYYRTRDWAVGRLQKPVEGAQPLEVPDQPIRLTEDMPIVAVSAYRPAEYRMPGESSAEPLAQACTVRRFFDYNSERPSFFYADCDNTPGGSGSPVLMRTITGRLFVVGIFEAEGLAADKTAYYDGDGLKSLTVALALDGIFLNAVHRFLAPESSSVLMLPSFQ